MPHPILLYRRPKTGLRLRKFQVLLLRVRIIFAHVALLTFISLPGCAPAVAERCSVKRDPAGNVTAKVTLQNRSSMNIVKVKMLVDVRPVNPQGGNRLFELDANLAPGDTHDFAGRATDPRNTWLFKRDDNARKGCEIDTVFFVDGSTWALGVPFI